MWYTASMKNFDDDDFTRMAGRLARKASLFAVGIIILNVGALLAVVAGILWLLREFGVL